MTQAGWQTEASRENFELVRQLVEHEDELINVRTSWTLAFHALLFNAFVAGVALYEKIRFKGCFDPIALGLIIVCVCGFGSAIAAFFGVRAAEKQSTQSTQWWDGVVKGEGARDMPPMYMHAKHRRWLRASAYFFVLAAAWAGLLWLVVRAPDMTILGR